MSTEHENGQEANDSRRGWLLAAGLTTGVFVLGEAAYTVDQIVQSKRRRWEYLTDRQAFREWQDTHRDLMSQWAAMEPSALEQLLGQEEDPHTREALEIILWVRKVQSQQK